MTLYINLIKSHMLSLFPSFLVWQMYAPLILRLVIALVFFHWSYRGLRYRQSPLKSIIGSLQGVVGFLFILGLYTQLAALVACLMLAYELGMKVKRGAFMNDGVNYYLILFAISLSLLLTGPGQYAFDLPL